MIKRMVSVLLLRGLGLGSMFGWTYGQGQKMGALASMPPPPATVAAAEVQTDRWQPYLSAVGSLVATQGIPVTTEVAGKVSEIHFESGQQVESGTLLLQLDESVEQAELAGIIAERRLAELQYKRREGLLDTKTISRSDVDEARLRLENATAQLATKRALIEKKRITAPFSGWLGIRQVDLGEYLQPGTTTVVLEALDPIYADFSLPERYLDQISVGQSVKIAVQAFPDESFSGQISAIRVVAACVSGQRWKTGRRGCVPACLPRCARYCQSVRRCSPCRRQRSPTIPTVILCSLFSRVRPEPACSAARSRLAMCAMAASRSSVDWRTGSAW